jgi:hypothetical protein
MIMSKRTFLLAVISVLLSVSAAGADQFRSFPLRPFQSGGLSGLLNNNNISMKNQFIFSFTSFNGSSFLQNVYLSSFSYKISPFWTLSLDLGATKFSGLSGPSIKDLTSPIIPLYAFRAEYKKIKDSRLIVNFGNTRNAFDAGRPGFPFPRDNYSAFSAPSGTDIFKNSDWSLYYEKSFFNDMLNVSFFYGHTAPPR